MKAKTEGQTDKPIAELLADNCPQCGGECGELREGVCETCCLANQTALDLHNEEWDHWQRLSDRERAQAILSQP